MHAFQLMMRSFDQVLGMHRHMEGMAPQSSAAMPALLTSYDGADSNEHHEAMPSIAALDRPAHVANVKIDQVEEVKGDSRMSRAQDCNVSSHTEPSRSAMLSQVILGFPRAFVSPDSCA